MPFQPPMTEADFIPDPDLEPEFAEVDEARDEAQVGRLEAGLYETRAAIRIVDNLIAKPEQLVGFKIRAHILENGELQEAFTRACKPLASGLLSITKASLILRERQLVRALLKASAVLAGVDLKADIPPTDDDLEIPPMPQDDRVVIMEPNEAAIFARAVYNQNVTLYPDGKAVCRKCVRFLKPIERPPSISEERWAHIKVGTLFRECEQADCPGVKSEKGNIRYFDKPES